MSEQIDTRGDIFPTGKYKFTWISPARKWTSLNGNEYWEFEFEAIVGNGIRKHKERIMPWRLAPLLRAFGFKETSPGIFDFDRYAVANKKIDAEIVHEPSKKNPGRMFASMTNISAAKEDEVPY